MIKADYPIDLCHNNTDVLITIDYFSDISAFKFELYFVDHNGAIFICRSKLSGSNSIENTTLGTQRPPKLQRTENTQES